jgi:hypothetical protein
MGDEGWDAVGTVMRQPEVKMPGGAIQRQATTVVLLERPK